MKPGLTASLATLLIIGLELTAFAQVPPGEPCGDRYICRQEAIECRCNDDGQRIFVALDHTGDGVVDITQHWVSLDPLELVRAYGDATESVAFSDDGVVSSIGLVGPGGGQNIAFHPILSGLPDIAPEAAMEALAMRDLDTVEGASRVDVVDVEILRRLFPDMMVLRGTHRTSYLEYPIVQSLLVVAEAGAEPVRVVDHLFQSDDWDLLLEQFAGADLSGEQDGLELAWVLAALVQQMFDGATIANPNALRPRLLDGAVEVLVARRGGEFWLRLELDAESHLVAIRIRHNR